MPSPARAKATYALEGKVALVTGGGSGIGEACVAELARCGATVAVLDRAGDQAERVATAAADAGGSAFALTLDVQEEAAVDRAVAQVVKHAGGLHIAVNNAGISAPAGPIADCTTETWRRVHAVNLDGLFFCLRAELRAMRAGGGSIVNLASILAQAARPGSGPYVSSKHAVLGLTRAAALDHAADGIRVNAVGPGHTRTPLFETVIDPTVRGVLEAGYPGRRLAAPPEIAEMIVWLASDASSFANGGFYPVDGGYLAQ